MLLQNWQNRAIDAENLCADREAKLARLAELVKKKRADNERNASFTEDQMKLRISKQQAKIDRLEDQISAFEFLAHQQQIALATTPAAPAAGKAKSKWDS